MTLTYRHTKYASYLGYVTQAIINNLPPLLFVTFQRAFDVSLDKISLLILMNFGLQMIVDLLAAKYVDRIGYRATVVCAHILSFAGLLGLGCFPYIMPPFLGLVLATALNAVGGGLIEVIISPIVEALPGDEKSSAMSLLHSFYCWGQVAVVALSTVYFITAGTESWRYLPILWAVIPFLNIFLFSRTPLRHLMEEKGGKTPLGKLFTHKLFWIFLILMACSGASEIAMSQWSSFFAETGLSVSKTVGDLLGPCAFAVLMGTVRTFYGIKGTKIPLRPALSASALLCVISYLLVVFAPHPLLSLLGCALCGLAVGLMWPGVFSLASGYFPHGGTGMFAILALAGDVGCTVGPGITGFVSDWVEKAQSAGLQQLFHTANLTQMGLKAGLLCVILFPAVMLLCMAVLKSKREGHRHDSTA